MSGDDRKTDRGFCPRCDRVGRTPEPCPNPGCRLERYAFIPAEIYKALKEKPAAVLDKYIGRLLDDFLLLRQLGKGGFGKVFYAEQLPLMMPAAVKLLMPMSVNREATVDLLQRFETEAQALSRLSHPNIVGLLKYGGQHDTPYLAMQFVEGGASLQTEVAELARFGQRLDVDDCWEVLSQIAFALQAAHDAGILHLDLKPDNVLIQQVPGYRRLVRLVDFGMGQLADRQPATDGPAIGSPEYLAPEQIKQQPVGPYTDLYALGVIAFSLLFQRSPFRGSDVGELVANKLDPDRDPAENLPEGDWPEPVTRFVGRALSVSPQARYPSAAAMLRDLEAVLDVEETRRG
jgi:serine/threonine-protein kinase